MIYSGAPHETKTRKADGVAICLDQTATKVWKDSGSEWVPISERMIKIRLYCAPIHITVIAVYSPINPLTKQMGDECDKFYNDLQDTLKDVSANDMIIIMGDLNAWVGQDQQKQQQQHETAKHHFPIGKNTNRKRKEWLTNDILKVLDQKSKAFIEWQNNRGSKLESKYHKNYKRLRKIAKIVTEHRQIEYWDEVCEDIEKSIKNNDLVTAFSIIRRLRGGSKRDENMPVQDKSGELLVNSKDTLKRWREYFHETLNVTTSIDQDLIDQIQILTLSTTEERR
ncbi:unnamed protein product [Rotaria sp. Silwood1]|nr:unnamed protein product [Rotaria sp. Silwood1]CAF1675023.1 unnamed protein product [Rotaria sp. Silwood1]CAF3705578.1 unnamed protein product [Rotaria sp. Silwood1]CAF4884203.1 unnamed protein product [Rotaria sp. Silwood1]CAF4984330.1 unnamed protein product [Rotaria sp. Silwood1]